MGIPARSSVPPASLPARKASSTRMSSAVRIFARISVRMAAYASAGLAAFSACLFCLLVLAAAPLAAAAPDFSLMGYAAVSGDGIATTTGGAGGKTVTVKTLAELEAWAADREKNTEPGILRIDGKISSPASALITIKNGANITIEGVGRTGELQNVGLNIRDYANVIVRNLTVHEVLYPNDALTLDNVRHGWVDHCELYSKIGEGVTVDTYDGLLDIKKGSSYITISWNYLHHHMKCSLVGHTDNAGQAEEDSRIRVTYHHNWFKDTDGRNPSLRFGAAHLFNNVFEDIADYGIAARDGAHAKVENCVYRDVKLPMATDKFPVDGLPMGYICESGNVFAGTTGAKQISQAGCEFWNAANLPYAYKADPTEAMEAIVKQYAGMGNGPATSLTDAGARGGRRVRSGREGARFRFEPPSGSGPACDAAGKAFPALPQALGPHPAP
jgi:pectate lyase